MTPSLWIWDPHPVILNFQGGAWGVPRPHHFELPRGPRPHHFDLLPRGIPPCNAAPSNFSDPCQKIKNNGVPVAKNQNLIQKIPLAPHHFNFLAGAIALGVGPAQRPTGNAELFLAATQTLPSPNELRFMASWPLKLSRSDLL